MNASKGTIRQKLRRENGKKRRAEEFRGRTGNVIDILLVTVHLFTKTKNDKENVAIQEKTQSWHEDERYAEGPRAHSFFSRVFNFFGGIFLPGEERKVGAYSSESVNYVGSPDPCHDWKKKNLKDMYIFHWNNALSSMCE